MSRDTLRILGEGVAAARRSLPTRAAVAARQNRLARRQFPWLLQHSSWIRRRFDDAGLGPSQWRGLPVVGKQDMMANFDELGTVGVRLDDVLALAREAEATRDFSKPLDAPGGPVTVGLSTGTSGAQGAFVVSRDDRLRWAGTILASLFPPFPWSLRHPQRVAFFLRADGGLYRSAQSRRVDIRFFDIYRPLDELARELTDLQPTVVVGPPSVLAAVASAGGRARPARVVSVAEVLEEGTAAMLATHFAAPVIQIYQATEGLLGLPCRAGELHLAEEHVHFDLEPVTDSLVQPVITDLRRRAQPIVRHRLGDLLELGADCACGLATRRVVRIAGRHDDALRLPTRLGDETTIWPDFFRGLLAGVPGLMEYRLVQRAATLHLQVAPWTPEVRDDALRLLRDALVQHNVDPGRVTLQATEWVPAAPGTKLRRVYREGE